jgi:hypothetical protein
MLAPELDSFNKPKNLEIRDYNKIGHSEESKD